MTAGDAIWQEEADEALMQRVAEGDRAAFEALVRRYTPRAYSAAGRMLYSRAEAEDTVQESFVRVWVHARKWDGGKARFSTWFYRILTNACIDRQRKLKRQSPLEEPERIVDRSQAVDETLAARQRNEHLRRALADLPDRQRRAVALCYAEGISNKEAAEVMGIHLKALEGLLVRARKTLRERLGKDDML